MRVRVRVRVRVRGGRARSRARARDCRAAGRSGARHRSSTGRPSSPVCTARTCRHPRTPHVRQQAIRIHTSPPPRWTLHAAGGRECAAARAQRLARREHPAAARVPCRRPGADGRLAGHHAHRLGSPPGLDGVLLSPPSSFSSITTARPASPIIAACDTHTNPRTRPRTNC